MLLTEQVQTLIKLRRVLKRGVVQLWGCMFVIHTCLDSEANITGAATLCGSKYASACSLGS